VFLFQCFVYLLVFACWSPEFSSQVYLLVHVAGVHAHAVLLGEINLEVRLNLELRVGRGKHRLRL